MPLGKNNLITQYKQGKQSLVSIRKKIYSFLELEKPQRIAIIADNDEDGFTSALQLKKHLDSLEYPEQKQNDTIVFFYDHHTGISSHFFDLFNSFNPEKVFFLDLSDGFVSEVCEKLKLIQKFVSIDHHPRLGIRSYAVFLSIKPTDFSSKQPSRYPVAKMVYDIFKGFDWIAALGIIGDSATDTWKPVLRSAQKKNKLSSEQLFGIADFISCIMARHADKKQEMFAEFYSTKKPKDLLSSKLFKYKVLFDKALDILEREYNSKAEKIPEFDLVFFKARDHLSTKLINRISLRNRNNTFIFYEKVDSMMKVSLRRSDFKVNCGELARYAIQGFPQVSGGGGHIPAAGAHFPEEKLKEFKSRVIQYLKENYKKH